MAFIDNYLQLKGLTFKTIYEKLIKKQTSNDDKLRILQKLHSIKYGK